MNVLITGGTGFIGRVLVDRWLKANYQISVLTRKPANWQSHWQNRVTFVSTFEELPDESMFDVVVNLAGEPIVDKRWSDARKQQLRESRVDLTKQLVDYLGRLTKPPKALLNASAIGFYGYHSPEVVIDESTPAADDFAATLCKDWEKAAQELEKLGSRVCIMRFGVVIGHGGALQKMLLPFRLGLGGRISGGEQMMSWIHLEDLLCAIDFLMNHDELSGPFNITSPNPVSNMRFSKTLAAQLSRPAIFPVPSIMLKLLLGEAADLLLKGQRVMPDRLLKANFEFQFADLKDALSNILPR